MEKVVKSAGRHAKRKAFKKGQRLIVKIVRFIGIPTIIALAALFTFIAGSASQLEKEYSALNVFEGGLGELKPSIENKFKGKATYVGVDDTDTDLSRAVLAQIDKYSNYNNPYYNGYRNLCEAWCHDMYTQAGITYNGTCCAYRHSVNSATKTGKIPKGALVFSGYKPDGTFYENGHAEGCYCTACNSWAGHIGIYIGNGIIVGSQIPYAMSVDAWIEMCGYGGYSIN